MKKNLLCAAILAMCTTGAAMAQSVSDGNYLVRLRGVYVNTVNSDSTGLNLNVDSKLIPEVDLTYFFTPNFAAELILTYPQKMNLNAGGTGIGDFKALPPTLLAQYHFTGLPVRPYVGVGINYTRISNTNLPAGVSIDQNSFGPALQVGLDVPINKNWLINFDVKKTWIKTDVSAGGSKLGTLKIDPWLLGVGVGYRF